MDYEIKYLKYKYKYINLKNLIGNGSKLTESEQLIAANIHPKIAESIISNKLNISKAIKLMTTLKGVKNTLMRSLLILQLLINNIPDKKIELLNINLFRYNLVCVRNISFNCVINLDEKKLFYLKIILYSSKWLNPRTPYDFEQFAIYGNYSVDNIVLKVDDTPFDELEDIFKSIVSNRWKRGFIVVCRGKNTPPKEATDWLEKNNFFINKTEKDLTEADEKYLEEHLKNKNFCVNEDVVEFVKNRLTRMDNRMLSMEIREKYIIPNINPEELIQSNEKLEELIKEIVSQKK